MKPDVLRILLVEDNPADAVLLQESLCQPGLGRFQFTHVERLAQALTRLQRAPFDVVLLDLSLSDSQGRDTFVRVRAAAPHVPIVVLTGVEDEAVALEALRQGIQDYLVKSGAYGRQTVRAIRYAIERKRTEEALQQANDELERRVQERTTELSAANRALQAEIAQRRQAEEERSQVLRRLVEAQETERRRVSRELHDQLGQDLAALKLGLNSVPQKGLASSKAGSWVRQLEALADNLMCNVDRLAWELRPAVLDDFGLDEALRHHIEEWSERSGVPVDFQGQDPAAPRLPGELETTLFRITQEALTNVARHAHARRVSVLLDRRPDQVSLILEDNGRGFDTDVVMKGRGSHARLGLLGMQERVMLAGGTIEIEAAPGAGTTLFVRLPLELPAGGPARSP